MTYNLAKIYINFEAFKLENIDIKSIFNITL